MPLGASVVFSIVALLSAFFHRPAGRVCAGISFGFSFLFILCILDGNGWKTGWLLHVLSEASPPTLVLYGSLLLSAVAVVAPLRRPGAVQADGERMPSTTRWLTFGLVLSILFAGAICAIIQIVERQRGEEKTRWLLSGDVNVQLQRVEVNYQQRRVICTDPEVLRYLENRLRRHEPEPNFLGLSYQLSLTYYGGGSQSFESYWTESGDFNLFLGEPGDGGTGHGIRMTQPCPRGAEELVSFLGKPNKEAAGSVLLLDTGKSRINRDPSLIAH